MAVIFKQPIQTGPTAWLLLWTSDQSNPTYRIYRDGTLIKVTASNEYQVTLAGEQTAVIEVRDDELNPASAGETQLRLSWTAIAGATAYRVEEEIDAEWVRRDDTEETMFRSGFQPDAVVNFRVRAIDAAGNLGSPVSVAREIIRHPDPPTVAFAYDNDTNCVEITQA